MDYGAQFVMMVGMLWMLRLFIDSSDIMDISLIFAMFRTLGESFLN